MGKVVKKELSEVVRVDKNEVKLCISSKSSKWCSYCKKLESGLRIEGGERNSRDMVAIFEHIHASGVPNFQGCLGDSLKPRSQRCHPKVQCRKHGPTHKSIKDMRCLFPSVP